MYVGSVGKTVVPECGNDDVLCTIKTGRTTMEMFVIF